MSVKSVLEDLVSTKFVGGALSTKAIAALTRLRQRSAAMGVIVFAAIVAGAALSAWMSYRVKHSDITIVASGLGLSFGAALLLLLRAWREWTQAVLLLILIEDADEASVSALIKRLIDKL